MKALSIFLRVVALLAAGFCVYAWIDTRHKISEAESLMADVDGETLRDKASAIPGILKESDTRKKKIAALETTVTSLENDKSSLTTELEGERAKNLKASSELTQKTRDIARLESAVSNNQKLIAERDETIEALKGEILKTKSMLVSSNEVDSLKEKVATLEAQLEAKTKAFIEADKKAKILDMAEIVEVVETNAEGQKIRKKTVKVPYIPTGDMATVIAFDKDNMLLQINKGAKDNVKLEQNIVLRHNGEDVSEIKIAEVQNNFSVGMVNRKFAFPETLEVGDVLEMCNPVAAEIQKKAAEKQKELEGATPAAEAPAAGESSDDNPPS